LKLRCVISIALHSAVAIFLPLAPRPGVAHSQDAAQKPEEKPANKQAEKTPAVEATENPAQIELLETRMRFEDDGASRKEVHTRVKINNELGARQFARLNFDYNRAFESIDVPLVRITHASGGTAEILPSAITDQPNPAVVNAPAYQDVRVKTVRILGLEPGDSLEYRIITTMSHHPLAPNFWLSHSFDRTGVVTQESFELDLPASRVEGSEVTKKNAALRVNPATPITSTKISGEGDSARTVYRWERKASSEAGTLAENTEDSEPDVAFSSFGMWEWLSIKLAERLLPSAVPIEKLHTYEAGRQELSRRPDVAAEVKAKALELAKRAKTDKERLEAIYDFVSQKIVTIDLSIGSTGFSVRSAEEILSSGYATPEDKFVLFSTLAHALNFNAGAALTGYCNRSGVPLPSVFTHLIIATSGEKTRFWIDPSLEVAPFGVISPVPNRCAFILNRQFISMNSTGHEWQKIDARPPFAAFQKVIVDGTLGTDGKLGARVHYAMRGDNELLLRMAFHRTQKEKWKDVAQFLALSDGFRGQVTSVTASDPYATKKPFTVEYEISQPKFVDWSKKPVRIPAVLPLVGLPDPPAKSAPGLTASPIDLGTPLDVETHFTLHLPSGTTATAPTGTSVQRDYAAFSSSYSAQAATITGSRHIKFLLREVLATRAADYNAFRRAVQNDETQDFTLERAETVSPKTDLAAPNKAAPPEQNPPKP
jgi:hypothetical protein